jgi:serine protease Do
MLLPSLRAPTVAALVLCVVPLVPLARAEVPGHALSAVVNEILPAVVAISADRATSRGTEHIIGSGFVIDPDGLILTNKHVIEGDSNIMVTFCDGMTASASLAGKARLTDIALLRISPPHPLPVVRFGDSDGVQIADTVLAIGDPLGFDDTVTGGIVSGLNRNIMESPFDDYIQTDAAINHGNSGGPLINTRGEVIGMNSVIFAPGSYGGSVGLGFAIPSNVLQFVANQLRRYGHVEPGWIGIRFQEASPQLKAGFGLADSATGALLIGVKPDSPAAAAGLHPGDFILAFDGRPVGDLRALARAIAMAPIGGHVMVRVWRNRTEQSLTVVPIISPSSEMAQPAEAAAKPAPSQKPRDLGLQLSDLTLPLRATYGFAPDQSGIVVTAVTPGSASAAAGISPGDLITDVADCDMRDASSVLQCLRPKQTPGQAYVPVLVHHQNDTRWTALNVGSAD